MVLFVGAVPGLAAPTNTFVGAVLDPAAPTNAFLGAVPDPTAPTKFFLKNYKFYIFYIIKTQSNIKIIVYMHKYNILYYYIYEEIYPKT